MLVTAVAYLPSKCTASLLLLFDRHIPPAPQPTPQHTTAVVLRSARFPHLAPATSAAQARAAVAQQQQCRRKRHKQQQCLHVGTAAVWSSRKPMPFPCFLFRLFFARQGPLGFAGHVEGRSVRRCALLAAAMVRFRPSTYGFFGRMAMMA